MLIEEQCNRKNVSELEELNGSSMEADPPGRCVYARARTRAGPRGACVRVCVCARGTVGSRSEAE